VSKVKPALSNPKPRLSNPKPRRAMIYLVSPDCVLYVISDTHPDGPDVQQLRQLRSDMPPPKNFNQVQRHNEDDIARLAMAIVTKASKKLKKDLTPGMTRSKIFTKLRKQCYKERDAQIYKHLKENVFPGKRSALLRLIVGFSKREAHMMSQSFKYTRHKDGSKSRTMLAPGSAMPVPVPFELADIKCAECEARKRRGWC
jgi:hypothetical protein